MSDPQSPSDMNPSAEGASEAEDTQLSQTAPSAADAVTEDSAAGGQDAAEEKAEEGPPPPLEPVVLLVIGPKFRDEEYIHPKQVFENYNIEVVTGSAKVGTFTGKFSTEAKSTVALADVSATDFDGIVFAGGEGAVKLYDDPEAHRLIQEAFPERIPVGAISNAPVIIARTGLLNGRMATSWAEQKGLMEEMGAIWTGHWVTIDAPFVTASAAANAFDFAEELVRRIIRQAADRIGVEAPPMKPHKIEMPPPDPGAVYEGDFDF